MHVEMGQLTRKFRNIKGKCSFKILLFQLYYEYNFIILKIFKLRRTI